MKTHSVCWKDTISCSGSTLNCCQEAIGGWVEHGCSWLWHGATGIRLCKSRYLRMKAAHLLCSNSSLLPRRGWWVQDTCPVAGRRRNKVHSEHTTIVNSSPAMLFYLTCCCINHSVFDTHFRGKYFTGYLHAHGVMTYFKHLQQQQDMQRF